MPGSQLAECDVAIVGAGFGGLCMAIKLREAGYEKFVILEKGDAVGGTWRDNTYPGAACDVRSHVYSFSFAPKADWSERFAGRDEIKAYIDSLVARYQLAPFIRFGQQLVQASWHAPSGCWQLRTQTGGRFAARHLVLATGVVHMPHIPDLPGLSAFRGKIFHSARWDHEYDLCGKRVASVGTGASAVQYLPQIAGRVAQLFVFQRAPGWLVPRANRRYTRLERWLYARFDWLRRVHRARLYWTNEASLWAALHAGLAKLAGRFAKAFIRRTVRDPRLQQALTPEYAFGCKRILVSSDYLPIFNRANVQLVTQQIREVRAGSIVAADGAEHAIDCLILGTGFITDPRAYTRDLHCVGLDGITLAEAWRNGASAYLGVTMPGFPNLFQLAGPNSVLAHNSLLLILEAQVHYVIACLQMLRAKSADSLALRPEAHTAFDQELRRRFEGTVWAASCESWYKQKDGYNFALWPDSAWRFWMRTRRVDSAHYEFAATGLTSQEWAARQAL